MRIVLFLFLWILGLTPSIPQNYHAWLVVEKDVYMAGMANEIIEADSMTVSRHGELKLNDLNNPDTLKELNYSVIFWRDGQEWRGFLPGNFISATILR